MIGKDEKIFAFFIYTKKIFIADFLLFIADLSLLIADFNQVIADILKIKKQLKTEKQHDIMLPIEKN